MDTSSDKSTINTYSTDMSFSSSDSSSSSTSNQNIKSLNEKKKKNYENLQIIISNKLNELLPDKKYLSTYKY